MSINEVFSTLSTKSQAQHAQLIHIRCLEPVFAQRTERLTIILLLLSKHPVVVKPYDLAHRVSQTVHSLVQWPVWLPASNQA